MQVDIHPCGKTGHTGCWSGICCREIWLLLIRQFYFIYWLKHLIQTLRTPGFSRQAFPCLVHENESTGERVMNSEYCEWIHIMKWFKDPWQPFNFSIIYLIYCHYCYFLHRLSQEYKNHVKKLAMTYTACKYCCSDWDMPWSQHWHHIILQPMKDLRLPC